MATRVYTAAGTQFAVSAALPATHTIAGFEALTFTDIAELVDGGSAGKSFNKVDHSPLGEREVFSFKGSYTQGARTFELGRDLLDAGQAILVQGLDSDNAYSFKITYQNGDVSYFTATIDSYTDNIGTIDSVVGATVATVQRYATVRLFVTGALTASVNAGGTFTGVTSGTLVATQASTTGTGTGAEFSVTLAAGAVTAVVVTATGTGYEVGDTVTLTVVGTTESVPATVDIDTVVTA